MNSPKLFRVLISGILMMSLCPCLQANQSDVFQIIGPAKAQAGTNVILETRGTAGKKVSLQMLPQGADKFLRTDLTTKSGDQVYVFNSSEIRGTVCLFLAMSLNDEPLTAIFSFENGDQVGPTPPPGPVNPYPRPPQAVLDAVSTVLRSMKTSVVVSKKSDAAVISKFFAISLPAKVRCIDCMKTTGEFRFQNQQLGAAELGPFNFSSKYPTLGKEVDDVFVKALGLANRSLDDPVNPLRPVILEYCNGLAWAIMEGGAVQ